MTVSKGIELFYKFTPLNMICDIQIVSQSWHIKPYIAELYKRTKQINYNYMVAKFAMSFPFMFINLISGFYVNFLCNLRTILSLHVETRTYLL